MTARKFARRLWVSGVASVAEEVRASIGALQDDESTAVCRNCGHEGHVDAMTARDPIPDTREFASTEQIVLCPDCQRASGAPGDVEACRRTGFRVDRGRALSETDRRCRACGISRHRLRLDGQRLELHPIVPIDAGGHHHEFNVVPLCRYCHRTVHDG